MKTFTKSVSLFLNKIANGALSLYQYSNMVSGQTAIPGVVFFVSKSLLGIESRTKGTQKIYNFDPKAPEPG